MSKKVILMILDGWGIATNPEVSAIDKANTPFVDSLYTKYSNSKLEASGLAVGLPEGQMGNSEVGHMNLGAGRIVYQDLVKINKAFDENTIGENVALLDAFKYAKENKKKIHFIGLASDGGVHAHIDHLKGLLSIASDLELENVFVHAFTDGRDTDPKGGLGYLSSLQEHMNKTTGQIASVVGRYFAMDRDNRWERVKKAYDVMVNGVGEKTQDIFGAIETSYANNVTDEFIEPIVHADAEGNPLATIDPHDVVICYNYRTDRGREITKALTQEDFPEQEMSKLPLYYVTMTNYDDTFNEVNVIFDKDNLKNTLGEVLSENTKRQIRIAETEKYPHVTFFFSGGREVEFDGESRLLAPSPKVPTYDLKPEMSAEDIKNKIIPELEKEEVDFVCLNFANTDMVGHTGVFEAAVAAAEAVDKCAQSVIETALDHGYTTLVIADHGNSDFMVNADGSPNTAHTTNLVPFIVVDPEFKGDVKDGKLGDVAPTILKLMGLDIPAEMTGDILV
ncbi:2,3-bisphosphoglycerate-independent phosphoglycerate mutase [Aureibacter tunicatorum]|uniref:2,3-bisphosphoglycerate-independent phosphoglycerate mutase n=1 Tax=Aureibacter tunicatorum TaxID=866807 RepID=A0AAE4BRE4_9BACT|nr:2,3-bisphosphoglycerate-independent phosphoglycerate mutase [Aureibacter tunicatorum]MDR6237162.1 2,3-bisphosphoglycerate-independent phosphoglycerate mutase [Aureibacter tunicatorum]BDD06154.1 2,3-bisphosphoglycerate-independent phosphoglycerate mutase [Aureibacter tunicatorum]